MRISITEHDGKRYFYVLGVDYGTHLTIVKENKKAIIVKQSGHRSWSGIGQTTYDPPSFITFRYTKPGKEVADLGTEFEYTGRKKAARLKALEKATKEFNRITKRKGI